MNIPDTRLILAGLTAAAMLLVVAKKQEVEDVFVPPSQRASLLLQTVLSHAPQAEALYKAILNKDATVAPYPIS